MRKKKLNVFLCVILCGAIISGSVFFMRFYKINEYKNATLDLPDGFTYTAHTGCAGTKDNSLESFEAGVLYGANIVEFDLNFDKDGNPVLSHDEPIGNEITLEEAFPKIAEYENLFVNVDVKKCTDLKIAETTALQAGILHRIFYTGINIENVEAVRKTSPNVKYYLNVNVEKPSEHTDEYLCSLVETVKQSGAIGINFNKDSASKKLVDKFHENGLLVSIFTVDDELEMYEILSYSPDNITTRNPDKLNEILKEYGYVRN